MKKLTKIFLLLAIFGLSISTAFAQHPLLGGGDGSQGSPYLIETPAHLAALAAFANGGYGTATAGKYYKLMNDLDLSDYTSGGGWIPIGIPTMEYHNPNANYSFRGNFDGNGKVVRNLVINRPGAYYQGLFSHVASGGSIKNLGVEEFNVSGYRYLSGLAAHLNGAGIDGCYVTGTIEAEGGNSGGLVGNTNNSATISNCYANVNATGASRLGSLIGTNLSGNITNCYSVGNINSTEWFVGGLAGYHQSGIIKDCVAANESIIMGSFQPLYFARFTGFLNGGTLLNNYGNTDIVMSYNGTVTSYQPTSDLNGRDGMHIAIAQLKTQAFYTNAANWLGEGWDFTNVWYIQEGESFPLLKWQWVNDNVPAEVTNLSLIPNASGNLSATISWTNPTLTLGGAPLTALTAVNAYLNDDTNPVYSATNLTPGGSVSTTITVGTAGYYTLKVIATNSAGDGPEVVSNAKWIGSNELGAPENLTANCTGEDIVLTWSAPSYSNPAALTYNIVRTPGNVTVATGLTATTFTDKLPTLNWFSYAVTAMDNDVTGGTAETEPVWCGILSIPYSMGFEAHELWNLWTIANDNCPGGNYVIGNWLRNLASYSHSGNYHMYHATDYIYNCADNDWFFSPLLQFEADVVYILKFWVAAGFVWGDLRENLAVHLATAPSLGAIFPTPIWYEEGCRYDHWTEIFVRFTVPASGNYSLGFRKYSPANRMRVFIDDISITKLDALTALVGNTEPMVNEPFLYQASVENIKVGTLSGYTVKLVDEENNVLAVNTTGADISPMERLEIGLNYTPTVVGEKSLRAILEIPGDPNTYESPILNIDVQPWNGQFHNKIGSGIFGSTAIPWNFDDYSSYVQTLYMEHEIMSRPGEIFELNYWISWIAAGAPFFKPVKIYMANTDLIDLSSGWIPEEDLTLVFDGQMYILMGQNVHAIQLDVPFFYEGRNLVIVTVRPMDDRRYGNGTLFHYTTDDVFTGRTRLYNCCHLPQNSGGSEFNYTQPGYLSSDVSDVTLKINIFSGSISGTVTSDGITPVEDVKVQIVGTTINTTTDINGAYGFPSVPIGEYQLEASKYGYNNNTANTTVVVNQNSVVNIRITPRPTYTVTFIVKEEGTNADISGASIVFDGELLSGYVAFNVFSGEYPYTVSHDNYNSKSGTITVVDRDISHEVKLNKLGIGDNILSQIVLYPNPFTNEIQISHPELVKCIQITDVVGQTIQNAIFNGKSIITEALSSGIYFVTVEGFNGGNVVYKMIKN